MPVLYEKSNPKLYKRIERGNLRTQWNTLETIVDFAIESRNFKFTPDLLFALHHSSAMFLDAGPGKIRTSHCHIAASKHVPPDPADLQELMDEFFTYLNDQIDTPDMFGLAAFSLWRLTWIHPFNECNGRTARAFCFLVLCFKFGQWLPGRQTIHSLIATTSDQYYAGLEAADKHYQASKEFNVSALKQYLKNITYAQLHGAK